MSEKWEKPKSETAEYSEEYKVKLLELADELLNEEGQENIQEYLDDGNFENTRISLLGALDWWVIKKKMSDEDAKKKYQILGFDPEEASKLRQRSKYAKEF